MRASLLLAAVAAAPALALALAPAAPAVAAPKPHLILMLVDDYGWNNVGFHARDQPNAQEIVTPHMDDLAANGIILDRHYVYRFCSPSRSSFQTGRNPIHVNTGNDYLTLVNKQDPVAGFAGIPRNMTVLAEKLAAAGYATAQAGKWRVRGSESARSGWRRRLGRQRRADPRSRNRAPQALRPRDAHAHAHGPRLPAEPDLS
jgi:arylsulfatase A-like enzyme